MAMQMTVADMLKDAMGLINAIEIDETPSSSEMNVALRTANVMIDRWATQHLLLRSSTDITFTTTAGKASYTFGAASSTPDVTSGRIISLNNATLTDNNIDFPLYVITKDMYDAYADKNIVTSRPEYICFDPGAAQQALPKSTVTLYFTPDKVYTVRLGADCYFTEFATFTEVVTFEPAYYEALIYNIAVRLFRRYSDDKTQIPPDLVSIANNSLDNLRTMNATRIQASMDLPGKSSVWNPYTDEYGAGG